jgi:cardiolipin synthase A/B
MRVSASGGLGAQPPRENLFPLHKSDRIAIEVTLICYNKGVVTDMQAVFADYLRHSTLLNAGEWATRPASVKFFDNLMRLTSALQ